MVRITFQWCTESPCSSWTSTQATARHNASTTLLRFLARRYQDSWLRFPYDAGMLHDRGGGNPPTKPPRRGSMRGRPGTRSFLLVSPTKWSFPCRQLKTLIGGATKFASRRQSRQRSSSKTYYNRREKRERRDRTLTPSANYEPFVNTVRIGDERDQFSLVYGNFQHRGRSQN